LTRTTIEQVNCNLAKDVARTSNGLEPILGSMLSANAAESQVAERLDAGAYATYAGPPNIARIAPTEVGRMPLKCDLRKLNEAEAKVQSTKNELNVPARENRRRSTSEVREAQLHAFGESCIQINFSEQGRDKLVHKTPVSSNLVERAKVT
jgi:hypothetical protein